LLLAGIWGLRLQRKIAYRRASAEQASARKKPQPGVSASRPVAKWNLDQVRTVEELKNFLQAYVHERYGLSKNASLEKAFSAISTSWAGQEKKELEAVINGIGRALYAGKAVEVEDLKKSSRRVIAALNRKSNNRRKGREKLGYLNPS
jgi:hypothetical protein